MSRMRTLNFSLKPARAIALLYCALAATPWLCDANLHAQESGADEAKEAAVARPKATDAASDQLIRNYLTVTGGAATHKKVSNVVAKGRLNEAGNVKRFELIELKDGRRHLTLKWRHLGRNYKECHVFDGQNVWTQMLSPKAEDPVNIGGPEAKHFSHQRWLLTPFVPPLHSEYVFKYQGGAVVAGRSCHVVVGFGINDVRSWFYFDKDKFLLLRWGGIGDVAGLSEYWDYSARKFKKVGGLLLPDEINLMVENSSYGTIQFDSVQLNQQVDMTLFKQPMSKIPVLRQRTR